MSLSVPRLLDAALEATIVGSFTRIGPAVRSRLDDWQPLSDFDLTGRTVLVTGGNGGLGTATVELLVEAGATVHITVRIEDKGVQTVDEVRRATGSTDVHFWTLDLMDLESVRAFAAEFREAVPVLDGLVHNAGAMFPERAEVDGVERTVLLHVVAPFLLTHELLPALRASDHPGRVVWVSSGGMYSEPLRVEKLQSPDDFEPARSYARAKRAQVVLTDQLAARLGGDVTVSAMHPGWAATPGVEQSLPTFNRLMGPLFRDPRGGADTAAWLVAADVPVARPGEFWLDRRPRRTAYLPGTETRPEQAMALWAEVTALAGLDQDAFAPQDAAA
jgi:NAD(P)-dependent dehydrogenase (short-subunit alcohol dehydrogenase family)